MVQTHLTQKCYSDSDAAVVLQGSWWFAGLLQLKNLFDTFDTNYGLQATSTYVCVEMKVWFETADPVA